MVAYLALGWSGDRPALANLVAEAFPAGGAWELAGFGPEHLVVTRGPARPRIRRLPSDRGLVIGDLYRRSFGAEVGDEVESVVLSPRLPTAAVAQELCSTFWGRYVALIADPLGGGRQVFRDPSGAVELMTWRRDGVTFLASHLPPDLPAEAWPRDLALDWEVISTWIGALAPMAAARGLCGLAAITPGALFSPDVGEQQIWSPSAVAAGPSLSAAAASAALPELLDACVRRLAGDSRLGVEISGGLDSAIIAGSVAATCGPQVVHWANYYAADRPADERAYARDVAGRWDVELTEVLKPAFVLTEDMLMEQADGLRPGLSALDAARDRDAADRMAEIGIERLFTGQGGDMVFFQLPTPLVVTDHLRRAGPLGLLSPYVVEVARWTRRSVWRTLGEACAHRPVWPGLASVAGHPWLRGSGDLPPAKRAQVATLAQKLVIHIEGLRGRAAEVLHPLLSQPIVEHCLAIPTPELTLGGRDRGLARDAFAARLPASIRERRSKGDLSEYYGRLAAASLGTLRPLLLEGELAARGLLDRATLEAMLSREHLIWRGDYLALLNAAVVEAWVRSWVSRLAGARVSPSQASTRA